MSVYDEFLGKNKSLLSESRKKVNENQVESDETVLEEVYTNQNVKERIYLDKCYMDDGTIEYVVNCNILGVEEWFTDFSKAKKYYYEIMDEFKREVDNYYEDDYDDDTISESAKQGEVSSVKKDYKKLVQLLSQASLALGDAWRIRNDLDKFAKKEDVYNTVVYILNNTKELSKIAKKVSFMSSIADGAKTSNFKVLDSENQ